MQMLEKYITPTIEIISIERDEIIVTSGDDDCNNDLDKNNY